MKDATIVAQRQRHLVENPFRRIVILSKESRKVVDCVGPVFDARLDSDRRVLVKTVSRFLCDPRRQDADYCVRLKIQQLTIGLATEESIRSRRVHRWGIEAHDANAKECDNREMTFRFTLQTDAWAATPAVDRIAGLCPDAMPREFGRARLAIEFARHGASLGAAVGSAIDDVASLGIDVRSIEIEREIIPGDGTESPS